MMNTKINFRQYFSFIKPQNFDTADIKTFTVVIEKVKIQLFDLFRRTHLLWSISILSPALNKVSAKYTFGHFS